MNAKTEMQIMKTIENSPDNGSAQYRRSSMDDSALLFCTSRRALGAVIVQLMQPVQSRGGIYKILSIALWILLCAFLLTSGFI